MKTEKIIQCIEWSAGSPRMKIKAKAELAALEADNAAMREKTIEECAGIVRRYFEPGMKLDNRTLEEQISALTPDSGKVQP